MPILKFPNPRKTGPEGLLALGGDFHPDSLRLAYSQGIFPWPVEGYPMAWFCPPERGVIFFKDLHIPRSLERMRKKLPYRFTIDQAFERVIRECAAIPRPDQDGTWIIEPIVEGYTRLHREGDAHSVEVWEGSELVGGIYGVESKGVFAGESMFYFKPYASKLALLHLIDHLKSRGAEWMDIQQLTPHMEALGAKEIPRDEFLDLLEETQRKGLKLF